MKRHESFEPLSSVQVIQLTPITTTENITYSNAIHPNQLKKLGIHESFVESTQYNCNKNVLYGLHVQSHPYTQSHLIQCRSGQIFCVAIDVRKSSPTFSKYQSFTLDSSVTNPLLMYIPKGFALGWLSLSSQTMIDRHSSDIQNEPFQYIIHWNDPSINIKWPLPHNEPPDLFNHSSISVTLNECEPMLNFIKGT